MVLFDYKARDKAGKITKGKIEAESTAMVADKLKTMNLMPVSINNSGKKDSTKRFSINVKRVKLLELNMFTRQLVTLLKAGLPLLKSLEAVQEQVTNSYFKDVISHIIIEVETGVSLSNAIAKYVNIFSPFYVSMIRIAETTGNLDETFDRLAGLGEKEYEIQERIKSSTRYPMLIVGALGVGFFIVVKFVLPRFSSIFARFEVALPLPTRLLLGFNYLMVHYWHLLIVGSVLGIFLFIRFLKTPTGKNIWDKVQLKLPVFGELFMGMAMAKFTRTAGTLVASGIPITDVLALTSDVVDNSVIAKIILSIQSAITEGKKISEPMRASAVFPPIVIQMVAVGEDTGKLDELLLKSADYYDFQVDYRIRNLTVYIEPLLLLVMGAGVLFIALAIFLPMWNMIYIFQK